MTTVAEPTLEQLDPATLLVDLNIREAKLDKDFVASIKDHGVIEPIVALRTEDGQVRVRHGHRRTLAAIEAGQPLVPVFIAGTEDNDEADRIARQWHENQHRAALTNVEQVGVVDQLALLGLSAATIARRLRSPKKHVESALTVRDSELARAATARYAFLTLEQSAVIADFEDATEAVQALVAAAKQGDVQFQRAAHTAAEDRDRARGRAALLDALTEAGVTVLDGRPDRRLRLDSLTDAEGMPLDAASHAQCPGHAAYLSEDWVQTASAPSAVDGAAEADPNDENEDGQDDGWQLAWVAVYACSNPAEFGHQSRYDNRRASTGTVAGEIDASAQEAAKEAARQERRTTLANNKAWREAEPMRRDWLRALAARKTAPKGAAALVTTALTTDSFCVRKAMESSVPLAADLLGLGSREAIEQAAAEASDARALLIALVVALAAYEDGTRVDTWRSPASADRRYFGWLADNGYPLADVEALAGSSRKGKRK